METTNLIRYADAYVPCGIYIDANGKILSGESQCLEYEYSDNCISGITNLMAGGYPPILEEIRKFNNGKTPCYQQIRTHKLSLLDIIAMSQYKKDSIYDNSPRVEMELELQRKDTILKNNYKQARIGFLQQKVVSYKSGVEDPKIDFSNLNSRFFDHLEQMLSSTNNDSTIACWLDEAIRRYEYMVESDEILDVMELIDVSDSFSNYDNTGK